PCCAGLAGRLREDGVARSSFDAGAWCGERAKPAGPATLAGGKGMPERPPPRRKKVLNVGGNTKAIAIPGHYARWTHHLLDIDPRGAPDILCDARRLKTLPADSYDAVYCSHNLE